MQIDWDNHDGSTRNRGTDGEGVIATYDMHGSEGQRIVHLDFHVYLEEDVQGRQLSHLCRAISTLIHKHLG